MEAVVHTPMRVFIAAGESGTGKTTNAKMVAQLLGMPYYFFTCGEGTNETDLVSAMIPNIGSKKAEPVMDLLIWICRWTRHRLWNGSAACTRKRSARRMPSGGNWLLFTRTAFRTVRARRIMSSATVYNL